MIDFDEQTTDDWDVDMSVYYDPYGGDKDARDMVKMRRDTRRRHGHTDKDDIDTVNTQMIGHFEKYTKVSVMFISLVHSVYKYCLSCLSIYLKKVSVN